jgi:hypothetical protein
MGSPSATTTISGANSRRPTPSSAVSSRTTPCNPSPGGRRASCRRRRAQRAPAHHHRRRRLRRAEHLRRGHSDALDGPHRQRGAALQPGLLHRAVLADPRRAHHRAQPPFGRIRRDLGAVHRLPRLQQHHRQGQGHHRPHPARQRLRHLLVRQGPQRAGLCRQPGGALRPVAHRHGLRVLLRLRRRRRQPVAAEPVPQHHPDLSLRGQAGEPGTWSPRWPTTPSTI